MPPPGLAVSVPFAAPLQVMFVSVIVTLSAVGAVIVTEAVAVHELASTTVTV